ncbi:MAG: hypothetical protein RMK65_05355 [Anaerolineae bacterium]|nr:hypothetical protein [Anaerolineae bacterium]MCX8068404.1 hypothetical protein [Anaerolineae bacterium]MDW7991560.1 hypothetical protein [Anaerolineae bacterium]
MPVFEHRREGTPPLIPLFLLMVLLLLASSCRGSGPFLFPTPSVAPSPTSPPTPTPTPVPTPLPPVPLRVRFPSTVSALEEAFVVVEAPGLPERDPAALLLATIYPPHWDEPLWESPLELENAANGVYRSREPIHFPLEGIPGEWQLEVTVRSRTVVWGSRWVRFSQRPLVFWDLAPLGPRKVFLRVPQDIPLVRQEGDEISGVLIWDWRGERLELWWTPGPTKRLNLDTALMVAEATYPVTGGVEVAGTEEILRKGRRGFRFSERWPEGNAEALVLQGADYRLYLLRARTKGGSPLSPFMQQIWETFQVD